MECPGHGAWWGRDQRGRVEPCAWAGPYFRHILASASDLLKACSAAWASFLPYFGFCLGTLGLAWASFRLLFGFFRVQIRDPDSVWALRARGKGPRLGLLAEGQACRSYAPDGALLGPQSRSMQRIELLDLGMSVR